MQFINNKWPFSRRRKMRRYSYFFDRPITLCSLRLSNLYAKYSMKANNICLSNHQIKKGSKYKNAVQHSLYIWLYAILLKCKSKSCTSPCLLMLIPVIQSRIFVVLFVVSGPIIFSIFVCLVRYIFVNPVG